MTTISQDGTGPKETAPVATKPVQKSAAATGDDASMECLALQLGWLVQDLVRRLKALTGLAAPPPPSAAGDGSVTALGGTSALSWQKADRQLSLATNRIAWTLFRMSQAMAWPTDLEFPAVAQCRAELEVLHKLKTANEALDADNLSRAIGELRQAAEQLDYSCRTAITASGSMIATAYKLGYELSLLCAPPVEPAPEGELRQRFNGKRLGKLQRWLSDVSSTMPPHSAHAVRTSVGWWGETVWHAVGGATDVSNPLEGSTPTAPGFRRRRKPETATATATDFLRALPRQGEKWRSILTGDRKALETLDVDDYVAAAKRMAQDGWNVVKRAGNAIWMALAVLTVVAVVALVLVFSTGLASTGKATAILVTIGGYLTAIWRLVVRASGAATSQLEQYVWDAELDMAVAEAITLPPVGAGDQTGYARLMSESAMDGAKAGYLGEEAPEVGTTEG